MKTKYTIEIGDKFGDLEVLEFVGYRTEPSGHRRRMVKVKCLCGDKYEIPITYLIRKSGSRKCIKCSGVAKRICNIGKKYDKLTVCGYEDSGGRSMVVCKCDCGTENVKIRAEVLKSNLTNNCGCDRRGKWHGVGLLSSTFIYRIKRNAEIRNLKFDLTIDELWELFEKQNRKCALSGMPLEFSYETAGKNTASLDRIDSKKDYTIDNVWWVHKDVNKIKMEFELNHFLNLCKMITEKTNEK